MKIFKALKNVFKSEEVPVKEQSDVSKLADEVYKTYKEKWKKDGLAKFASKQKEQDIWSLDGK